MTDVNCVRIEPLLELGYGVSGKDGRGFDVESATNTGATSVAFDDPLALEAEAGVAGRLVLEDDENSGAFVIVEVIRAALMVGPLLALAFVSTIWRLAGVVSLAIVGVYAELEEVVATLV